MVYIQYADISKTIDIKRAYAGENLTLRGVVDAFSTNWKPDDLTISGRPIKEHELDTRIGDLAIEAPVTGDKSLLIEKHR